MPRGLAAIRSHAHRVNRDYEGYTHRDIVAPTLLMNYHGDSSRSPPSRRVWWKTADATDLDYTTAPLATRQNDEKQ